MPLTDLATLLSGPPCSFAVSGNLTGQNPLSSPAWSWPSFWHAAAAARRN
jgi:hypothetical protein